MTAAAKLELCGLEKSFGSNQVLKGVNLRLETSESLVVIGGSGVGKSVILKCVLGLLEPDRGQILIDGQELIGKVKARERNRLRRKCAMLFQNAALFDSLLVWQNVAFGLFAANRHRPRGQRLSQAQAKNKALDKLASVGLGPEVGNLYPSELSGGMRKRVSLARTIATDPEIIFFDEPTTGLDPISSDVINNLIVKCVQDLGATALSITHDMTSARRIADRIAMIHDGRIIWQGGVDELDRTNNPYVNQFTKGQAEGPIAVTRLPVAEVLSV